MNTSLQTMTIPQNKRVWSKYLFRFDLLMAGLTALFFSLIALVLLSLVGAASWSEIIEHVSSPQGMSAIFLSLATSLTVVALTLLIGFPVAYILALKQFKGKAILETLIDLPIIMPPLVTGLSLLLLLKPSNPLGGLLQEAGIGILFTPYGIVLAQFFVASPFFIKTARESIVAIPGNLLAASATLNASDFYTFRKVILPLCRKGACAGLAMTWARALGEFGATAMVAGSIPGKTETMTISIYMEAMSGGMSNSISTALVLVMFSFTLLFILKVQAGRQHEY
ncbi:ABC transporter permease [uncultured Desulfuromusa sp.]|uniref:ABC transporter permease n=1 Tax=uncultured Desulfuromusa sp. TaxID=219183 RepID=UPI002AA83C14|nr:ABC transporter permease [uncultured Desulfuromusa sp.]